MTKMSRSLWIIAIFKLVIMFGVLKIFFFQKYLDQFETEQDKIEYITKELTQTNQLNTETYGVD